MLNIQTYNFDAPILGVVTVVFNSGSFIEEFLDCCLAQTFKNYKLLIIDNNSSDESVSLIKCYRDSRIELLTNSNNVGYAEACNQGINFFQNTDVKSILFVNNDTTFNNALFGDLMHARQNFNVDAITPRITYASDPSINWYAGGKFNYWRGFQGQHLGEGRPNNTEDNMPRLTPVASGCCVLFSKDVFMSVGFFDPIFFVYAEDTDFFIRMQKKEKKLLYHPGIVLNHKVSLSTGGPQSNFSIHYHHRNQIILIRKHLHKALIPIQIILIFCKIFLRFILGMDTLSQLRLRISSMIEGFKV